MAPLEATPFSALCSLFLEVPVEALVGLEMGRAGLAVLLAAHGVATVLPEARAGTVDQVDQDHSAHLAEVVGREHPPGRQSQPLPLASELGVAEAVLRTALQPREHREGTACQAS